MPLCKIVDCRNINILQIMFNIFFEVLYMSCNVATFQLKTSEGPSRAARDQALEMIEMFSFIPHLNKNILYDF